MSEYIITDEQFEKAVIAIQGQLDAPINEVFITGDKLPELVRCRDCDYEVHESDWQPDGRFRPMEVWWCYADRFMGLDGDHPRVELDGFCKWGKRRDGE